MPGRDYVALRAVRNGLTNNDRLSQLLAEVLDTCLGWENVKVETTYHILETLKDDITAVQNKLLTAMAQQYDVTLDQYKEVMKLVKAPEDKWSMDLIILVGLKPNITEEELIELIIDLKYSKKSPK
jgi:hypothetical protein